LLHPEKAYCWWRSRSTYVKLLINAIAAWLSGPARIQLINEKKNNIGQVTVAWHFSHS
jgi:hypothetical protein